MEFNFHMEVVKRKNNRAWAYVKISSVMLEKEKIESNKWTLYWVGDLKSNIFEVHFHENKLEVDLLSQTCTCRMLPCRHVITAIRFNNHTPEVYYNDKLTTSSYNTSYEYYIIPTTSQQYSGKTPFEKPTPPPMKRRYDCPKKSKRRDQNKSQVSNNKLKRTYKETTCTRCGHSGHNKRGCTNSGVPLKPKN
ncbi:hypothetical protein GmHk_06G016564 [Glycine max]|nr:hypothetical protein GmHk_06G016564 [Glycine max]